MRFQDADSRTSWQSRDRHLLNSTCRESTVLVQIDGDDANTAQVQDDQLAANQCQRQFRCRPVPTRELSISAVFAPASSSCCCPGEETSQSRVRTMVVPKRDSWKAVQLYDYQSGRWSQSDSYATLPFLADQRNRNGPARAIPSVLQLATLSARHQVLPPLLRRVFFCLCVSPCSHDFGQRQSFYSIAFLALFTSTTQLHHAP